MKNKKCEKCDREEEGLESELHMDYSMEKAHSKIKNSRQATIDHTPPCTATIPSGSSITVEHVIK